MSNIKVINPGFSSSLQDLGRQGNQSFGVPISGPMDSISFKLANAILDNFINDAVMGIPLGLSSISYLVTSLIATYVKNMTVNTSITTDWFTFFVAIFFANLAFLILITNFSEISVSFTEISYNTFFTLIFFPFFWFLFNIYNSIVNAGKNV